MACNVYPQLVSQLIILALQPLFKNRVNYPPNLPPLFNKIQL